MSTGSRRRLVARTRPVHDSIGLRTPPPLVRGHQAHLRTRSDLVRFDLRRQAPLVRPARNGDAFPVHVRRELATGVPWSAARSLLEEDDWSWFDLGESTEKHAFLTGSLGDTLELHREGVIRRGPTASTDRSLSTPVRIDAEQHREWFPTFAGHLEASRSERGTLLALDGDYVVPIGPAGELIDRLLLHSIAESSLSSLLSRIAAGLQFAMSRDRGTSS